MTHTTDAPAPDANATARQTRVAARATAVAAGAGLAPYTGAFGRPEAWHLLRRSTFGVRADQVDAAVAAGLEATLETLAGADAPMYPPINYDFPDDPYVPIGATWVEAPYVEGVDVGAYRIASYYRWLVDNFLTAGASLERRLLLFLLNHFGAAADGDVRTVYTWYELLRRGTREPFDELVKAVTIHPLMLRFLDGRTNSASSPNENYARELLELFTVGKGPQVGPGDYTNFTEHDIRQIARALTGWRMEGEWSQDPAVVPEAQFRPGLHDDGPKPLSERLGGRVIESGGEGEYAEVVDIIFDQADVGHYVCRKLYRWFCHHHIDEAVEREVIDPMSEAFATSGWRLLAPVRLLLGSAHFFETGFRGAIVKSPLDELCDLVTGLGFERPTPLEEQSWILGLFNYLCGREGMDLVSPPSVAGYKAYHQAPLYNRFWVNAATLEFRRGHAGWTIWNGYDSPDGVNYRLDLLGYIALLENPSDPNALVADLVERLFPAPLTEAQRTALKHHLIPGLPDFEWTVEYGRYLDDPSDEGLRMGVLGRLNNLFYAMTTSAEFHLY